MPDPVGVDLLVTGAAEVLTCAGDAADLIGRIPAGEVAVLDGVVAAVGNLSGFTANTVVDASGGVVLPGFVDAHTHVVFGGDRAAEYAARVGGAEPPAGAAVGIVGTVARTRTASHERLRRDAHERVAEMLAHGTTTVESKSGYGLDGDTELTQLRVNAQLSARLPVDLISTYLGAHAFPPDVSAARYVDKIVGLIPDVAAAGLAQFCDVYCDDGYFSLDQTRRILEAGVAAGLRPKLHLDAYSHTGAADLAIDLGAVSADHLNYTEPRELERLAAAGVVGVYMPCLEYAVQHPRPLNARAVAASGIELALATDICPGCWTVSMQLAIAMACRAGGLSVAQAIRAATYGAARALGRDDLGSLVPGSQADLIILDVPTYEHVAYRLGRNNVRTVIKRGVVVRGEQP